MARAVARSSGLRFHPAHTIKVGLRVAVDKRDRRLWYGGAFRAEAGGWQLADALP